MHTKHTPTDEVVDVLKVAAESHGILFLRFGEVLGQRLDHGILAVNDALKGLAEDLNVFLQFPRLGLAHDVPPLVVQFVQVESCGPLFFH